MATPIPTLTSQINHCNMQNQTLKHQKSYREGQAKIRIEIPEKVSNICNKRNKQLKQMK
jgi:hypothetical protein